MMSSRRRFYSVSALSTRLLTEDQLARHQPWFDNARRLKDLILKLEAASLAAAAATEGWPIISTSEPANTPRPNRSQPR
jgi:hypothetical protein